ncbi:phosphoribosylformylglycinamidine cyclo-ligase, chloroplastic/mitochondrial [Cinnamomum micranthum f. kanehirae]|uniref:phosphoribosylformylglycinamidine cyclo-ligase n=1 Tax=Cinnamomum micranthum f. kanehirae TaxID=337451 RepID=A0A443PIG7_9MAGN|nr:phosphoribosylformylglycinamidine cyclo-ligase, chloroplastic/mitochondrial [Cinnamomum micranthum f. kanehirae]
MNWTTSCLGLTKAEAFHGVFTSVAAPKPFIEKSYFPPKRYASLFFQRSSQKPNLSFSHNARTSKSIGIIRECDYGGMSMDKGRLYSDGDDDYGVLILYGVGSKLKLAIETGIHETIGIDLVALIVNNILTFGAKPTHLSTLYSSRLLDDALSEKVAKGVLDGCRQAGCKFLGETAIDKLNYFFEEEYDLGCCAGGIVKKDSVIDGKNIVAGDYLVGLPSSAVHWSGFSLVRRALAQSDLWLEDQLPGGSGKPITLGEALMAPTVIYVKQVLDIISKGGVKGIAHITRGGLTDSILRVLPKGLGATIYRDTWEVPAVLKWIQEVGRIEDAVMRRTFGMGIEMVLVVSPEAASRILQDATSKPSLERHGGYLAYTIGEVSRREGVTYL